MSRLQAIALACSLLLMMGIVVSYRLNMFRTLLCPSSEARDYVVELPHWLISFLFCGVLELGCGSARVVSGLPSKARNMLSL